MKFKMSNFILLPVLIFIHLPIFAKSPEDFLIIGTDYMFRTPPLTTEKSDNITGHRNSYWNFYANLMFTEEIGISIGKERAIAHGRIGATTLPPPDMTDDGNGNLTPHFH